jgi:DNA-binding transcriptional regulator GbsR (MarR family)
MERVIRRVIAILSTWGISDGCSSIYAVLIAAHEPLSAEEIGERANYAYSSTINYLNSLIRMGLVTRMRRIRKNLYRANMTFVELIKAERRRVKGHLNQLRDDLEGITDLEHLRECVDHAIVYLGQEEDATGSN